MEKPTGAGLSAQLGMFSFSHVFNASDRPFEQSWIIDSGATDHMTNSSKYSHTYTPCSSSKKIVTADGSLSIVPGEGNIKINPNLILENVLHVLKLFTNLISIVKLSKDLNCKVTFFPSHCEF